MGELKWNRFTEDQPSDDMQAIWMTDFKEKWVRARDYPTWEEEIRSWRDDLNKCGWIEIQEPELQKKD